MDISVFTSFGSTGHCNRTTADLMLNFGMIDQNIEEYLDLYFQYNYVIVNPRDLAVMAATLANKQLHWLIKG